MNPKIILAILAIILAADSTMYGLIVPFLPGHARELGLTETSTGLLFASYPTTLVFILWFFSTRLHKYHPRSLMMISIAGLLGSSLAFAVFSESVAGLFIARAFQGAAGAAPWIIGPAVVAQVFPKEGRGSAMGILLAGSAIGSLAGPPLGGFLYELGGFSLPFYASAGLFAVLLVVTWLFLGDVSTPEKSELTMGQVIRDSSVRATAMVTLVPAAMLTTLQPLLPLDFEERFEANALMNGALFAVAVITYAAAAPLSGRLADKIGRWPSITCGLLFMAVCFPSLPVLPTIPWVVVGMACTGVSFALTLTPAMPALADAIDRLRGEEEATSADYGLAFILFNFVYSSGAIIGPTGGGFLAEQLDLFPAMVLLAGLCVCAAVASVIWIMKGHRR